MFGRVVEQYWATSGGSVTDDFTYGYDRDSNRLYRANYMNHNFDELYHFSGTGFGYDGFNQLTNFERGVLSASQMNGPLHTIANPSHSHSWNRDGPGNCSGFPT